jgi:hypothetical protein
LNESKAIHEPEKRVEKLPIGCGGKFSAFKRKIDCVNCRCRKPRAKRIDGIVAAGDVFSKGQLGKQRGSSQSCRGFRILIASLCNGSVRDFGSAPAGSLAEAKAALASWRPALQKGQKRNPWDSICAEIHSVNCPRGLHSQEQSHEMTHSLQELQKIFSRQPLPNFDIRSD